MLETIQQIYNSLLAPFPEGFRPIISVALGIVLMVAIVQTLRQNIVWLIVVVILLPASVPILKGIAEFLVMVFKLLLGVDQPL